MAIRLITQPNSGPGVARNRGAADAQRDLLTFTDDDCSPSPAWLHTLAEASRDSLDCGIGGKTINLLNDNLYSAANQLLLDYLYEYYNQDFDGAKFFASDNLAFPRKGFLESGGFDAKYRQAAAEDRELCDRWVAQDRGLRYLRETLVSHAHSLALGALW